MKKNIFSQVARTAIVTFAITFFLTPDHAWAQAQQPQLRQSVERKFEEYRRAIRDDYQIDIKNYKDKMPGGHADGKAVINYDLKQLLLGINFERDHTKDNMLALELAMDHLERIPDYYTRLEKMDAECRSEKISDM